MTAMKTMSRAHTAPPEPSRATAANGSTSPAETSASDIRSGKVGKDGVPSRANPAKPMVVAQSQGMANHDNPPMM